MNGMLHSQWRYSHDAIVGTWIAATDPSGMIPQPHNITGRKTEEKACRQHNMSGYFLCDHCTVKKRNAAGLLLVSPG